MRSPIHWYELTNDNLSPGINATAINPKPEKRKAALQKSFLPIIAFIVLSVWGVGGLMIVFCGVDGVVVL